MNFVLFENDKGKATFVWESELDNLPDSSVAFTHYQQDNVDENGFVPFHEYRIGVPIRFILGDMFIQLDSNTSDIYQDNVYCLYIEDGKRKFKPMNSNMSLVNSFSELEEAFSSITRNEQVRK